MTHYLYPQNLKASANMWFWSLKDFAILGIAALLSIVMLVELRFLLPAAATLCFAFLSIRMDETTILDYLRYAARYFLTAIYNICTIFTKKQYHLFSGYYLPALLIL